MSPITKKVRALPATLPRKSPSTFSLFFGSSIPRASYSTAFEILTTFRPSDSKSEGFVTLVVVDSDVVEVVVVVIDVGAGVVTGRVVVGPFIRISILILQFDEIRK